MTDEEKAQKSPVRERFCPSCRAPVERLQLSSFAMPAEQVTVPWLRMMNATTGFSARTFGQTGMNELQFLAFINFCQQCTHISWWDLGVDELEYILANTGTVPSIAWTSSPDTLSMLIEKIPESHRENFRNLLHDVTPKSAK